MANFRNTILGNIILITSGQSVSAFAFAIMNPGTLQ